MAQYKVDWKYLEWIEYKDNRPSVAPVGDPYTFIDKVHYWMKENKICYTLIVVETDIEFEIHVNIFNKDLALLYNLIWI